MPNVIAWFKALFTRKPARYKTKRRVDLKYNPLCSVELCVPQRVPTDDVNQRTADRIKFNEWRLIMYEEAEAGGDCGGVGKCLCAPQTRQLLNELDKMVKYQFEEGDFHAGPGWYYWDSSRYSLCARHSCGAFRDYREAYDHAWDSVNG